MPNNERQRLKKVLNSGENDVIRALTNMQQLFNAYLPPDLSPEDAQEIIFNCLHASTQNVEIEPMVFYRELVKHNQVKYLGKYDQHLFNIGSIVLSLQAILGAVQEFKIWEKQIVF